MNMKMYKRRKRRSLDKEENAVFLYFDVSRKASVFAYSSKSGKTGIKPAENTVFLFTKLFRPFREQLVLDVLHQICRLAVENFANLIKGINR